MNLVAVLTALAGAAAAQMTLDFTNKEAVIAAAKSAMGPLKQYFDANAQGGAWIQNTCNFQSGCWVVQWHESALYFDLWYQYTQWSGDKQYLAWMEGYMTQTVGGHGDFLGGYGRYEPQSTRWNDDIAWWGVTSADAAVALGKDSLLTGDGHSYVNLTETTFDEVWDHWDGACGGGLYWGRDRKSSDPKVAFLKSTITNAEMMEIAARLFALTGESGYKSRFNQIWGWLKTSGIVTVDYYVADGVDSRDCQPSLRIYSYHVGELLSAHSAMYSVTKDEIYRTEATNLFNSIVRQFVANNTISIEPSCDATGTCKTPNGYWWPVYRGIAAFFAITNDPTLQKNAATVLRASALRNFQLCNAQWYCIRNLPNIDFKLADGTNVRDQFETVFLTNALAAITLAGADAIPYDPSYAVSAGAITRLPTAPPAETGDPATNGGASNGTRATNGTTNGTTGAAQTASASSTNAGAIAGGVIGGIVVLTLAAAGVIWWRKKNQAVVKEDYRPAASTEFIQS